MPSVLPFFVLLGTCLLEPALSGWGTPLEATAKISDEEREQMSKEVAVTSRRAYAPTKARVAKFLEAEAPLEKACPKCADKDYSDPCPLAWAALADGRCVAPAGYAGECSEDQSFIGSSAAEKMELEITCGICWPCARGGESEAAMCRRDWAQPCPNGYSPQDIPYNEFRDADATTCAAELLYEGECEQQVIFKDVVAKQEFSERCQTSWPCHQTCGDSYAACPDGWESVGDGLCMAPESYKANGCPLLQGFHGWSNGMKTDFAEKCGVSWPCSTAAEAQRGDCQQLDLSSCPRRWAAMGGGGCAAPPDIRGDCAEAELANMSDEQKLTFAADCGVEWPCFGEIVNVGPAAPRPPAQVGTDLAGPIDAAGHIVGA